MKIFIIIGTRPEAIKLAPVIYQLKKNPTLFKLCICLTAQHRKLLDQAIDYFEIKPDYDLDIMTDNQTMFDITIRTLEKLRNILNMEKPDLVLVQGDTTSAFSGALAASYYQIPVCHVEAGLRTKTRNSPFPEEINRRLISVLTTIHFAPTAGSKQCLMHEGIQEKNIYVTGNTSIDTLVFAMSRQASAPIDQAMHIFFKKHYGLHLSLDVPPNGAGSKVILVTVHRRENMGNPLSTICKALISIQEEKPDVHIAFCHHLNTKITKTVKQILKGYDRIHLIEPLDYPFFVYLLRKSHLVLTDSGGIQEEATYLGKPILILRTATERHEAITANIGKVIGTEKKAICENVHQLLTNPVLLRITKNRETCFGDGSAGRKIVQILMERYKR